MLLSLQTGSQVERDPGEKKGGLGAFFLPQATLASLCSSIFFSAQLHLGACSQANVTS